MKRSRGFTLIELLVVIAIIAILAAILFPVFSSARKAARGTACLSNLHQIGMADMMYIQTWNGFPYGLDSADMCLPSLWGGNADVAYLRGLTGDKGLLKGVLKPYIRNPNVWACPSDIGAANLNVGWSSVPIPNGPVDSVFRRLGGVSGGMSYMYQTALTLNRVKPGALKSPATTIVNSDAVGYWHLRHARNFIAGNDASDYTQWSYNVLFADWHTKCIGANDYYKGWYHTGTNVLW